MMLPPYKLCRNFLQKTTSTKEEEEEEDEEEDEDEGGEEEVEHTEEDKCGQLMVSSEWLGSSRDETPNLRVAIQRNYSKLLLLQRARRRLHF
jgi:hypothetical protein